MTRTAVLFWSLALALAMSACGEDDAPADVTAEDLGNLDAVGDVTSPGDVQSHEDTGPDAAEVVTEPPGIVRFIHFSDPHYNGTPKLPVPAKMDQTIAILNELDFDEDLVFVTGDLCHFVADEYDDPDVEGPHDLFVGLMDKLDSPWHWTLGNHEYYSSMDPVAPAADKQVREDVLADALGGPLYYSFIENGIRFIALNSGDGEAWATNDGVIGSFSDQQLEWLGAELARGQPSIVFLHHPPGTTAPIGDQDSLCDVITANPDTVKGIFSGHLHEFMKGEYCGVPAYVSETTELDKTFYYMVEYDGVNDTLTILNEHDIPFVTPPEFECEVGSDVVEELGPGEGSIQKLQPTKMSADAPELGKYVGEVFEAIPIILSLDGFDDDTQVYSARLTMASRWGEVEGYLSYLHGLPCFDFHFSLNNPCFTAGPATFNLNILIFLPLVTEEAPELSYDLPVTIENFWIEGKMALDDNGIPVIDSGILHGRLLGTKAMNDIKSIFAAEYCAGNMEGCEPGSSEEMPACPDDDPGIKFYPSVPDKCDFQVAGYSMRMILMMAESFGISDMDVIGEVSSKVLETSAEPVPGLVQPDLFSTDSEMNCSQ